MLTRRKRELAAVLGVLLVALLGVGYLLWFRPPAVSGPATFPPPARNAITFWGHACVYLDLDGFGIVTDPVFSPAYMPTARRTVGAPDRAACAGTRLILISHAHADHLSPASLERFPASARILCPPDCARLLGGRDGQVLKPWEEYAAGGVTVIAVPARHPGRRFGRAVREDGAALGYVVRAPGRTIYYSGDTELFAGLAEIGRRFRPDVAVLNVSVHLHSEAAARAARDLGARVVIPAHWGAYTSPGSSQATNWRGGLRELIGPAYHELPVGGSFGLEPEESRNSRKAE